MTLTVLAEDHPHPKSPDLKSDHGFALHADLDGTSLLYDFGNEGTLVPNSEYLNIDLARVDSAILSHGHHDHSGGMADFLKANDRAKVRHGRGAFHSRWSISGGAPRDVGVAVIPTDDVVERLIVVDSLTDEDCCVLLPAAPGHYPRPAGNASLLAGPEGNRLQDDFTDELTLVLRGAQGLVVVSACSHRGILNILTQVRTYCPNCPIIAVIGGFHLTDKDESAENLDAIGTLWRDNFPETRIITGHCTGAKAITALEASTGRSVEGLHVGKIMKF